MSQATGSSANAKTQITENTADHIVIDLPPITIESINERLEEQMSPEEWVRKALIDEAFIEGNIDVIDLIPQLTPHLTKIVREAQAAAVRKAMRAS